jgi:hypothetical protein
MGETSAKGEEYTRVISLTLGTIVVEIESLIPFRKAVCCRFW